ncbi:flagellar brake protein [Thermodesulfobacteriota bacterium]
MVAGLLLGLVLAFLIRKRRNLRIQKTNYGIIAIDVAEDPKLIQAIFTTAREKRTTLKIRLNNRGQSFSSSLLRVAADHLLIDALFPYEGNELIEHTELIGLEFVLKIGANVPYRCVATYQSNEFFEGLPAVCIALPTSVKRDQKRNYHRVEPSVKDPVLINFNIDGMNVTEKVVNISGGGIGFYTNLDATVLWSERLIEKVSISLPDPIVVNYLSIVHTIHQGEFPVLINKKTYNYFCGAEFADIDTTTRDSLIKYVIEKEREDLKHINRAI